MAGKWDAFARVEVAQELVGAPVLGEFDRGANELAAVLFKLAFEPFEQGEGVSGAAGETGQDFFVVEPAHLARRALDDDIAQGHLAVAAYGHLPALRHLAAHADDGGSVKLFHTEESREGSPEYK